MHLSLSAGSWGSSQGATSVLFPRRLALQCMGSPLPTLRNRQISLRVRGEMPQLLLRGPVAGLPTFSHFRSVRQAAGGGGLSVVVLGTLRRVTWDQFAAREA